MTDTQDAPHRQRKRAPAKHRPARSARMQARRIVLQRGHQTQTLKPGPRDRQTGNGMSPAAPFCFAVFFDMTALPCAACDAPVGFVAQSRSHANSIFKGNRRPTASTLENRVCYPASILAAMWLKMTAVSPSALDLHQAQETPQFVPSPPVPPRV